MKRLSIDLKGWGPGRLGALAWTGAMLVAVGCADEPPLPTSDVEAAATVDGTITPISRLPLIDSTTHPELLATLLARPTELGETTALHVKLPPPRHRALADTLVRVIGDPASPHVLFRSDALVQLGVLRESPGRDFFAAFVTLGPEELDLLARNQAEITAGAFGRPTSESVVFSGRSAIGRTVHAKVDPEAFRAGRLVALNRCFLRPLPTAQALGQSIFLTAPAVVLDPARTWDPCTGAGTKGGAWTFAHFIREMAIGSGQTAESFARDWLAKWLNNYTVNGDVVPARTQMFNQVIQPWAVASGVTATLFTNPFTGVRTLSLSGPLDLDIAPFRLEAIVNRIDLGERSTGGGGRYGAVTGTPTTSGELRFIFGVVQPSPWGAGNDATCGKKRFTTIFEYGVPGTGCAAAVSWAKQWTQLAAMPGFTPAYLAQLEAMTESVVRHGAAPAKGNQNAINQIRTNEIAIGGGQPWELREFTLSVENPAADTDTPTSGPLRAHTVAQTPNDGAFSAAGADPTINAFVTGPVTAGLALPVALPNKCDASYEVPFLHGGAPFRGGNALIGVNFWKANSAPATPDGICARHAFSLTTCQGCHHNDSGTNGLGGSTNFVHIDPLSTIPVTLSKFLTGGGIGSTFGVNDTQFATPVPAPQWQFADLQRRFDRLFDISHCTACTKAHPVRVDFVERAQAFGPIPIDVDPKQLPGLRIGPVTDLATVSKLLELRVATSGALRSEPVDFVRTPAAMAH
jgi:hypothetical protein